MGTNVASIYNDAKLFIIQHSANVRYLAREPSEDIFAVQCQETTPTNNFACEIPLRGSLSQF